MKRFRLFAEVEGVKHALVDTDAADTAGAVAAGKTRWPDQKIVAEEIPDDAGQLHPRPPAGGYGMPDAAPDPAGIRPGSRGRMMPDVVLPPMHTHPMRATGQPNTEQPGDVLERGVFASPDESTLYLALTKTGLPPDAAVVLARAVTNLRIRVEALEAAYLGQPLSR